MNEPIARLSAALSGRYTIERELGGGSMSRVFAAIVTFMDVSRLCISSFQARSKCQRASGSTPFEPEHPFRFDHALLRLFIVFAQIFTIIVKLG